MSKSDIGPFAIVPEWVAHGVTPGATALFVELALHANRDTNESWPSRSRLARRLDVSVDTVDRRMAELVGIGAVKKTPRHDQNGPQSNLYLVVYARPPLVADAAPPRRTDAAQNQNQLEPEPRTIETLAPRERDAIWDLLVEVYGEPTGSGRGARNAAVKVLRDYGADLGEIADFIVTLNGSEKDWAVTTPSALAKHFGERFALMAQVQNGRHKHDHAAQLMREAMNE